MDKSAETSLETAIDQLDISPSHILPIKGYGIELQLKFEADLKNDFQVFFDEKKAEIPKHIHQVWIGENDPPWLWINGFKECFIKKFPDWSYTLWREKDIARLKLQNQKAYDDETQLSGKVNILRYELLYQFGGIYIDADMEWLNEKPLEELILQTNETGLFAGMEDKSMLANSVIGSSPKNPILKLLICTLGKTYALTRKEWRLPTWQSSGPRLFSEVCKYFPITRFPMHYFYPVSWLKDPLGLDTSIFKESYMIQYGYTTNGLEKSL